MAAKRPKTNIVLACLFAVVLLAIGAVYLFRAPVPATGAERAAAQIARNCAGGNRLNNEGEIAAGLGDYLTKASGKASVTSSDIGALTAKISSDETGLKFYDAYVSCLTKGTENWLRLNGVAVEKASGGVAAPVPAPPAAANVSADRGIALSGSSVNNSTLSVDATHR